MSVECNIRHSFLFVCKRPVIFATPKTLRRAGQDGVFCPARAVQGVATRKEFFNGGYTKIFPCACFVPSRPTRECVFYVSLICRPNFCYA